MKVAAAARRARGGVAAGRRGVLAMGSAQLGELKRRAAEAVDRAAPRLIELSDYIHDHPELGHQEVLAQAALCRALRELGLSVQEGVAGLSTSFRADLEGRPGGPTVAFLAEYDALPDIGHGCGHNLIGAAAVGAAAAMAAVLPGVSGRAAVIGTPAEEVPPATKGLMVDRGAFAGVDVALIMHGGDRTTTGAGSLAVEALEMVFLGRTAHASKYPELGISALDAACLTMHAIEILREHVRSDVRIHGIVSDGGRAPNIVPERAALRYYVRALQSTYLDEVVERVKCCARAGGLATGAAVEIKTQQRIDNKLLLPALDAALLDNARAAGAPQVMPPEPALGSTDFGNVTHRLPGSTLKMAIVAEETPSHTREWAAAAGGEAGHRAVLCAAKALAWTALDLMLRPDLLEKVRAEFSQQAPPPVSGEKRGAP